MANPIHRIREILTSLRSGDGLSRDDQTPFAPMQSGDLTIDCRSSWPTDLQPWNDLSSRVPTATVFQCPAWQIASWTAGRIHGRLRFIRVCRGNSLLAVLPLCLNDTGGLHSPGASLSDYLDPLIEPQMETDCWRAILSFIAAQWDRRIVEFTLHNIRERANCRVLLHAMATAAGFTFEEKIVEHAPAIQLPQKWDLFLDSLDPHERKEIRRKLNKAETQGGARLTRCETDSEVASMLPRAIALMATAGGDKGTAVSDYIAPLLKTTAHTLIHEGHLDLLALHIHGELACCLLQFPSPIGPMLYNLGYDTSKKEWSPGVVAVAMSIRNAISQGASVFDLLRGREAYKYKLGAVDRPLFKLTLKKP